MPTDAKTGVYYEVHGKGVPLFMGFPYLASYGDVFGKPEVLTEHLRLLTDRYRVLVADYPSLGKSADIPPNELTVDRVCADVLAVADAAGFERFAWWGYTWGAIVGMHLASRTKRVSALVCGGWPPLGAQYADMLAGVRQTDDKPSPHAMVVLRYPAQYRQWAAFYGSMEHWPEAEAVARIACPAQVFYGENAQSSVNDTPLLIPQSIRAHKAELERLGWTVSEIPDADSGVFMQAERVLPVVRAFLDRVT